MCECVRVCVLACVLACVRECMCSLFFCSALARAVHKSVCAPFFFLRALERSGMHV